MTQPLDAKVAALKTLLPLLWSYMASMPGARTTPRYGDSTIPGPPPPEWLVAAGLDCGGECHFCDFGRSCRGDIWEAVSKRLSRQYRLAPIAAALVRLQGKAPQLAQAVNAVYVEPYDPKSEPVRPDQRRERERWAEAGVRWIARNTSGEFVGLGETKLTAEQQVERLVNEGVTSPTTLAQRVGCTVRHAKRLKLAMKVRSGSTVSALDG